MLACVVVYNQLTIVWKENNSSAFSPSSPSVAYTVFTTVPISLFSRTLNEYVVSLNSGVLSFKSFTVISSSILTLREGSPRSLAVTTVVRLE